MNSLLPCIMIIFLPFMFQSNSSLLFLWIILELSSIMFISMSLSEEELKKKECFLMYFLVQSFASAFLLICLFSWSLLNKNMMMENPNNMSTLIMILMALKIAMGPMHFWLIKLSKLISWFSMGVMLTWQKIIPLSFLSSFSMGPFLMILCIITLLVGTFSQLKLTSLKMLIAFSSVGHLGWMIFPLFKLTIMSLIYLLIYSTIVMTIILMLFSSNYQYLFNQLNYKMMSNLFLLILSLSGIPPMLGFLLKWMSLMSMASSIMMMILFSFMACMSFYIYIRITYKSFMLTPFSLMQNNMLMNMKWSWMANFFLPIIPILW